MLLPESVPTLLGFSLRHGFCITSNRSTRVTDWIAGEEQQMGKLLSEFWRDDRGYVPAMEWILVASILTLGAIAAQVVIRTP
jgi:hypothetical protein